MAILKDKLPQEAMYKVYEYNPHDARPDQVAIWYGFDVYTRTRQQWHEILEWTREQIGPEGFGFGNWTFHSYGQHIFIKNETNATAFKLRWM